MADPKIPLSDLPLASAGPFDKVAGVDVSTGAARLFPMPSIDGLRGYATKADLDADRDHPAGTLALVTNDPTPANNGTYRKTGAPGSGSWVKSADRVTGLEGRVGAVEVQAAATGMSYPNPNAINLDLNAGLLKITASQVRVFYGRSSFLLAGQDIALPSGRQRVIANVTTGEVSFTKATTTPSTHVILGSYDHQEKKLIGFPPHFVNGVLSLAPSFGRVTAAAASAVTFDLAARQLVLTNVRITTPTFTGTYSATIAFPANASSPYRLEFERGAATPISFVAGIAATNPQKTILGFVRVGAASVDVYGIDQYLITGGDVPIPVYEGTIIGVISAQYINFDWFGGFLRITAANQVRCLYGRNNPYVPVQDVALPEGGITQWQKVLYNTETGALSFLSAVTAFQPGNTIVVGMVKPDTQEIYGFPAYYVNGQPSSSSESALEALEWLPVDGPTEPRFTVPALLPDFKTFGTYANTDHATAYALYDALVSAYPDYVTRTTLGLDDAGKTIYRYDFRPPADNGSGTTGRLAKMILISGVHGYERAGVYCLYSALHQVCSRWADDELLDTLRWNCHFIVVPMAVPDAFDRVDRLNPNGVDIARNFTAGWSASQDDPGPSPLSEKESQYLDAIMSANTDAIYCGSFHNFMDSELGDPVFIWNASATMFGIRLTQRLVSKMSRKWKSEYAWLPQNSTALFGYADPNAPLGSEGRQSTLAYGIQGGTFEISRRVWVAPDSDDYSAFAHTLGCETVVNWLLMNLEHGTQLYNGRGS